MTVKVRIQKFTIDFTKKIVLLLLLIFFIDDDDEVEGEEDEEDSDELSDEEGMWIISDIWFLFCVSKLFLHVFFLQILLNFSDDDGEMTLSDLYKKNLDDDEDGEDFVEGQ